MLAWCPSAHPTRSLFLQPLLQHPADLRQAEGRTVLGRVVVGVPVLFIGGHADQIAGRNLGHVVQRQVVVADRLAAPTGRTNFGRPAAPPWPRFVRPAAGCRPSSCSRAPRAIAVRRRRPCPAAPRNDSGRPADAWRNRRQSAPSPQKYLPSSLKMNSSPSKKTKSTPILGGCSANSLPNSMSMATPLPLSLAPTKRPRVSTGSVQRKGQRVVVAAEHDPLADIRD